MGISKVYIVRCDEYDLFTIGSTSGAVQSQIESLQKRSDYELKLHRIIESFFPERLEEAIRQELASCQTAQGLYEITADAMDEVIDRMSLSVENGPFNLTKPSIQGIQVTLVSHSGDSEGNILLSSSCVTASELEFEVNRLIASLQGILEVARKHKNEPGFFTRLPSEMDSQHKEA